MSAPVQPFTELTPDDPEELLYAAWQVIANVGLHQGAWEAQHPEWIEAAKRWRDVWHERLALRPEHQPVPADPEPTRTPRQVLEETVGQAIGEASMCWEKPEGAGVFDSTHASQVVDRVLGAVDAYVARAGA